MTRPPRTVPGFLAWRAAHDPEHVAVEVAGEASLTLGDWDAAAGRVAGALHDYGLLPGDRVALRFGAAEWRDFAIAYCGVQRAGGVAVPVSDRLAPAQIAFVLEHCGATALLHGAASPWTGPVWSAAVPALLTGSAALADASRPEDLAQILYTSGTTGRPKGVAATHANLTVAAPTHPRRLRLAHSTRFAHAFPIGTNAAQTMLFTALFTRPGALTPPRFTPARFARLLQSPGVGTVFLVPSTAIELLESGALAGADLSRVHLVGSTAAALAPATASRLAEAFPGAAVVNYYTSTEAAPAEVSMIFDPARPGALGRPAGGALMIADGDGEPLPAGAAGEVWLRSPYPRAYHDDPAATAATFRGEWVRMGDVGRIDADGYLYLLDRAQDVVKSGAFKISTLEVEAALLEHPLVAAAAVVGVPHPVLGAVLAAVVVPAAGAPPGAPDLAAVRRFLAGRLADHQLPARVQVRPELPRNDGGKVLKRELVRQLSEGAP